MSYKVAQGHLQCHRPLDCLDLIRDQKNKLHFSEKYGLNDLESLAMAHIILY